MHIPTVKWTAISSVVIVETLYNLVKSTAQTAERKLIEIVRQKADRHGDLLFF